MFLAGFFAVSVTVGFCCVGQFLANESEKLFVSGYNCKWYLWNVKNRKLLQIFLINTQESMVLTSSGLITINFQLLISVSGAHHQFRIQISKVVFSSTGSFIQR